MIIIHYLSSVIKDIKGLQADLIVNIYIYIYGVNCHQSTIYGPMV